MCFECKQMQLLWQPVTKVNSQHGPIPVTENDDDVLSMTLCGKM